MGKKNATWADVEADLKKYCGKVLSSAAGKIRDELTEEAFNAIVYFYTSWAPKYYRRHYYNFLEKSFEKYYSNPHGTIYRGGVKLTPEEMDDIYQHPKNDPDYDIVQEVFDSVYAGFHGVSSMFVNPYTFTVTPVMDPSPMERIYARRDYIERHIDEYIDYGKSQANSQSYSTIKVR